MSTMITKSLEILAPLTAGAGALTGLASESMTPLLAGVVVACACHALVASTQQARRC